MLINIEMTNRGTNADSFVASLLGTVGSSNVEHEVGTIDCGGSGIAFILDRFDILRRMFPGGSLKGNICAEVPTSDVNSLLLFGDYFELDLTDRTYRDDLWFWKLR